jgi:hypothetical protein
VYGNIQHSDTQQASTIESLLGWSILSECIGRFIRIFDQPHRNHGFLEVIHNVAHAAQFHQRAATTGHRDGASNLEFCLEHGCGVEQHIELVADYYQFAADHGHSEAQLNYHRCLRLLRRWKVPDRSSDFCGNPPSDDSLASDFIACLEEPSGSIELLASIARFRDSIAAKTRQFTSSAKLLSEIRLGEGDSSVVTLIRDPDGNLSVMKLAKTSNEDKLIEHEAKLLKALRHPLILQFREYKPGDQRNCASIVTEFAVNGSLADHLPWANDSDQCQLRESTKIAKVVIGIVLVMRFIHEVSFIAISGPAIS